MHSPMEPGSLHRTEASLKSVFMKIPPVAPTALCLNLFRTPHLYVEDSFFTITSLTRRHELICLFARPPTVFAHPGHEPANLLSQKCDISCICCEASTQYPEIDP